MRTRLQTVYLKLSFFRLGKLTPCVVPGTVLTLGDLRARKCWVLKKFGAWGRVSQTVLHGIVQHCYSLKCR